MSARLEQIKRHRASGSTVFCDWAKHIDWMIEQIEEQTRQAQTVTIPRRQGGYEVYDLSPAMKEGAICDKLVELGWRPPQ